MPGGRAFNDRPMQCRVLIETWKLGPCIRWHGIVPRRELLHRSRFIRIGLERVACSLGFLISIPLEWNSGLSFCDRI